MADNLAIVYRSLEELIPYARNARTHTDAHVAQIAASIREFGWTNPVLVDGGKGIIAGHGRVLAARKLGIHQVPCIELAGLSEAQRRAYILADNKLALNAGWDESLLRLELADLRDMAFDLSLIGFGVDEQAALLAERTEGLTDPDDAPEVPEHPVSELGDLWLLGKHRLLCGDSTVATDVERVLGGVEPHLMVTDPPYGMNYQMHSGPAQTGMTKGQRNSVTAVIGDDKPFDPMPAVSLVGCREIFLWGGDWFYQFLPPGGSWIVWDKRASLAADSIPGSPFEVCWSKVRHSREFIRVPWGGWNNKEAGETERLHPTQKPVECMRRPIENNSSPGQAVYEPFSGSGTTIIAAEMTGRACHAIELSAAYIDVGVKRWQDLTGAQATLDGDGRTFDEIAAERQPQAAPEERSADAA